MKAILNGNALTLCLEGRIDSNNAADIEAEIFAAVNANPDAAISLDAENLKFISSAGLRVLMKLRKHLKKPLPVLNVFPEVYEIFEVTGFTELLGEGATTRSTANFCWPSTQERLSGLLRGTSQTG